MQTVGPFETDVDDREVDVEQVGGGPEGGQEEFDGLASALLHDHLHVRRLVVFFLLLVRLVVVNVQRPFLVGRHQAVPLRLPVGHPDQERVRRFEALRTYPRQPRLVNPVRRRVRRVVVAQGPPHLHRQPPRRRLPPRPQVGRQTAPFVRLVHQFRPPDPFQDELFRDRLEFRRVGHVPR